MVLLWYDMLLLQDEPSRLTSHFQRLLLAEAFLAAPVSREEQMHIDLRASSLPLKESLKGSIRAAILGPKKYYQCNLGGSVF